MKSVRDFQYYVATTQQESLFVVAFCPECGNSMTLSDLSVNGLQYSLQNHQCYQKIVSVPK